MTARIWEMVWVSGLKVECGEGGGIVLAVGDFDVD